MKTLQETPETMERVENSYLFKKEIHDLLEEPEISLDEVIEKIAQFVNINYSFNGK